MIGLPKRMSEDMRLRDLSPHTQKAYLGVITRFIAYSVRSLDQLDQETNRGGFLVAFKARRKAQSLALSLEPQRRRAAKIRRDLGISFSESA